MPTAIATFASLTAHFAHEPHWWPLHTDERAYEVTVGMVLVQQTRWETVEAAVLRLISAGYTSFDALASANPNSIAELCKPCAFYTRKAAALVALAQQICLFPNGMTSILSSPRSVARQHLLALPQIGRESADTILLYAGDIPLFIVDAYARRFLSRSGIVAHAIDAAHAPYDAVQTVIEAHFALPDATTARELHAMMVEVCIHHCTANHPRCMHHGHQRRFVDARKCASHCHACVACPAAPYCHFHQSTTSPLLLV
jgi:endonuclease-3 related protein